MTNIAEGSMPLYLFGNMTVITSTIVRKSDLLNFFYFPPTITIIIVVHGLVITGQKRVFRAAEILLYTAR